MEKQAASEKKAQEEEAAKVAAAAEAKAAEEMSAKLAALAAEAAKPCQVCSDKDALIESLRAAVAEAQALAQTVSHHHPLDHAESKKP